MTRIVRRVVYGLTAPVRLPWRAWRAGARALYRARVRLVHFFTAPAEEHDLGTALETAVREPRTLAEHLEAFRPHLFRALAAYLLAVTAAFVVLPQLLALLTEPVGGLEHLQAIEVTEPLGVTMRVAMLAGFVLALPYIYLELYAYVAPGLQPRTRVWGLLALPLVLAFFVAGMAFAYFVMLPVALPFLLNFMGIPTAPRPASYIRFVTGMLFWVGLAFETPLMMYLLARLGWVRYRPLRDNARVVIVALAVLAAVITPTPDPVNMLLVLAPLVGLFYLGLLLVRLAERQRATRA